jgi:hypothetical protein
MSITNETYKFFDPLLKSDPSPQEMAELALVQSLELTQRESVNMPLERLADLLIEEMGIDALYLAEDIKERWNREESPDYLPQDEGMHWSDLNK